MKQFTIQNQVTVKGVGLHTGKSVILTFKPAEANHGYRFQRIDLEDQPVIPADVKYVYSTNRGTTLKIGDAQVSTVEHVLSALVGLGIDNVLLEIDGPEMPIMDGTAKLFVDALKEAGLVELDTERDYYEITEPISYKDEVTGTEIMALPSDHFEATVMIDFNSSVLGQQFAALSDINDFETEIAPCRTFVFLHELEKLLDMGLIKGGALDNAIVIADRKMEPDDLENLSKKLNRPNLDIDPQGGVLNTIKLHFQNEPARHKLLDVVGDLALVGKPIKGKIVATKPGHTANTEFAKILKKDMMEKKKLMGVPKYDHEKEPVLDINGVSKMLPHRYPFLLVDKIIEISRALRRSNDVGLDAKVFNRPHLAGATGARLHLVNNDGDAVLVGDRLQAREELLVRDDVAALTLNWLHHKCGDLITRDGARDDALLQLVETLAAKWHMQEAWCEWTKVGVILRLRICQRECTEGSSMEAADEADDPLAPAHVARQLNGGLDCLGP